ncbi:MAG: hypothetical protein KKB13_14540 [Chloroflexi bacterium]|nr:hypothetical protein [Chloroflexota bacterium]
MRVLVVFFIIIVVAASLAAPVSAQSGLSVSGYAFTTPAAAEAAARTGSYAGGRWVVQSPVVRAYGSVYYTNAGWVVAFVVHQPPTRTVNPTVPYRTGFDVFWFQALGQDTQPFWW